MLFPPPPTPSPPSPPTIGVCWGPLPWDVVSVTTCTWRSLPAIHARHISHHLSQLDLSGSYFAGLSLSILHVFLIDIFKEDLNDCEPIIYDQVNSHLQRHADDTQFCFYGECIPPPFPPKLQGWKFAGRTMFFLPNGSSFTSPILTAVTSQPYRSAASISLSLNCFVVWCLLEIKITRGFWKLWSRKERKGQILCIRILRIKSQAVQTNLPFEEVKEVALKHVTLALINYK